LSSSSDRNWLQFFPNSKRSPLAVSALVAGEIDMAVIGPGHLVNAAVGGTDVIGIANFAQKLDYRLNTRPEIKKKEDLRGKRIAISGPGSTSHLVSLLALQHLALDPNAAKIAFLTISGTEINRRLALESGSIDATTLNGSVGDLYGQKGYPVLFLQSGAEIGTDTLSRFYSLHMLLLPGALIALIGLHLYLVVRLGVTSPPWSKKGAGRERPVEIDTRKQGLLEPRPRGNGPDATGGDGGGPA